MNLVRTLLSSLIVAVMILSVYGIAWWGNPPEKLAGYAGGGQLILGLLIALGLAGLWRLWAPAKSRHSP